MKKFLLPLLIFVLIINISRADGIIGTWRWRNNNGNEKNATWKAGLDSSIVISSKTDVIRLRLHIKPISGYYMDTRLQYGTQPTGFLSDTVKDGGNDPTAPFIYAGNNEYVKLGEKTTQQMPSIDNGAFYSGAIITKKDGHFQNIPSPYIETELEWVIIPTNKIQAGTTYYFSSNHVESILPEKSNLIHYAVLTTSNDINHPGDKIIAYHISTSNNFVTLNFTTALKGHDHFELQYIKSGFTNWTPFKTIPGDNVQLHQTTFDKPQSTSQQDTSIYYMRIALFDMDKVMSVSPAIKFTLTPSVNSNTLTLKVSPNPAKSNVSFNLKGYSGKTFNATLTTLYGRQMNKKVITVNQSGNYTLDSNIPAGTYLLNIEGKGIAKSSRVLVQ